ncbi:EAL domain-containing protein [Peribacillus sp. B-H-3]|uniref:EAL domain-containing protein n=1 Tax=Peribacillus sp. B-H-3 TaxID=3400420 RepID=UPI003B026AA4
MRENIKTLMKSNKMEYVYQPLWNIINWKIYGYESLLRCPAIRNFNPEDFFKRARMEGCLFELDSLSIKNSIINFPFFNPKNHPLLFINIFPSTLIHSDFECLILNLMKEHPYIHGRLVFELNETSDENYIWKTPKLKKGISLLKDQGFYVALDDVGQGEGSLQNIIEMKPNYIKLDKYFSEELAICKEKQAFISFFVDYCNSETILILEGVEKEIDLAQAKYLKVPIVQGYLLGKPEQLTLISPMIK